MYLVLNTIGWLLSKLPLPLVQCFSYCLGALFFHLPTKRRRIIYSNLHHAFPERSPEWLRKTVWRISQRTIEMGLYTIACPHFSDKRFIESTVIPEDVNELMKECLERGRPMLGLAMHFSMIEPVNAWPVKVDYAFPKTSVMYRPHKNPKIDAMIKKHRERCGFQLVSRKEGLRDISNTMRENGFGIILFDQNTRSAGNLIPFFGRVTAATDLPGIVAKKFKPSLLMLAGHRVEFWKCRVIMEELQCDYDPVKITLASNRWLEDKMRESDEYLVDWLWSHNRWKILHRDNERLGMNYRKKAIDFSQYSIRKTRIALLTDRFAEHEKAIQKFLKALRISRPDAEVYLMGADAEVFRSRHRSWVDVAYNLRESKKENNQLAKAIRDSYLDVLLVLKDDPELQRFAATTQIPQRFGVSLKEKKRKGLTKQWSPENPLSWELSPEWLSFGKRFGLEVPDQDAS